MINLKSSGQGLVTMMFQAQNIALKRYHVTIIHKRTKGLKVEIWAESEEDALPHELFYQARGFVIKK